MQPITDADREQEFDELDPEFESSDEEDRNVFKIRDALEVPTTRNITARSLHCPYQFVPSWVATYTADNVHSLDP